MVPSLFISHGTPYLAVETNEYTKFLNNLGKKFTPRAVVIFSAHWESEILSITYTDEVLDTVYDYYGFPKVMYEVKYPAKGSIQIASLIEKRFENQGIRVRREEIRGLDHGSWVALKHMYPNADVPVVQISVNPFISVKEQYKIGNALKGIGAEDILVIGSGTTVHNLREIYPDAVDTRKEAIEFDDWLIEKVQSKDLDSLNNYLDLAPHARFAVPRPEHFVPLFNAMGSAEDDKTPIVINRSYEMGTFSNLCFEF